MVIIESGRPKYDSKKVATRTWTVKELIESLKGYNDDEMVIIGNDYSHTYSEISAIIKRL